MVAGVHTLHRGFLLLEEPAPHLRSSVSPGSSSPGETPVKSILLARIARSRRRRYSIHRGPEFFCPANMSLNGTRKRNNDFG